MHATLTSECSESDDVARAQALENDEYRRKTEGYLPTAEARAPPARRPAAGAARARRVAGRGTGRGALSARGGVDRWRSWTRCLTNIVVLGQVAFLDEVFKANSAILNTLLTLLNERAFDNGPAREAAPLLVCVAASNERPDSDERPRPPPPPYCCPYPCPYCTLTPSFNAGARRALRPLPLPPRGEPRPPPRPLLLALAPRGVQLAPPVIRTTLLRVLPLTLAPKGAPPVPPAAERPRPRPAASR